MLADRIVMLDQGKITLEVEVPLPRPRERGLAEFAAQEGKVLRHVLGNKQDSETKKGHSCSA
ncbi:hypothetical protein RP726_17150 [Candidatus Methylospira mobilis]|uniref:hypothetical protein n=1 Tax=Candidatus Methylospira mobilis TaxID=1808979 RepID=UPI001D17D1C4|nr:hypothetical protein [Candidatus Methylospira mobilis]WNV04118.1 hypothetical protein RP726_17150 [Candidatus Methylospira mobilis]